MRTQDPDNLSESRERSDVAMWRVRLGVIRRVQPAGLGFAEAAEDRPWHWPSEAPTVGRDVLSSCLFGGPRSSDQKEVRPILNTYF